MATRRPSKAEIKRRVEQTLAPDTPTPALPPHIDAYLQDYQPRIGNTQWAEIRPFVVDVIARYGPTALDSTRQRLATLIPYVIWCVERGYPLQRNALLDCELIEAFAAQAGLAESTAANYRSRLRGIVRRVNPAGLGVSSTVAVPHQAVKPPYSADEVAAIVRIARTQPNPSTGRQLRACVGLGLGAGLDSPDLRQLRVDDVHDEHDRGLRISVPGSRARTTWVLADFEEMVRSSLEEVPAGELLIGKSSSRHNLAARIFEAAHILGDAPHFEQSRMRTTWLARLLSSRVPLPVLKQASGLRSARTITDLLPHLDIEPGSTQLLRGEH